nr:MAG TPA: hypothetical protein [Caudoviricetes sp.]
MRLDKREPEIASGQNLSFSPRKFKGIRNIKDLLPNL